MGLETFRLRYSDARGYELDGPPPPLAERVMTMVATSPGIGSRALRAALGARGAEVDRVVADLLAQGQLRDGGTPTKHAYYTAGRTWDTP